MERHERAGLRPHIKTCEDYHAAYVSGVTQAYKAIDLEILENPQKGLFTSHDLNKIHSDVFKEIGDWAGKPAGIRLLFGEYKSAVPKNVRSEMDLSDKQSAHLLSKAKTEVDLLSVIAFQHSRLIHIHGFNDGNGRTSRMLLAANLRSLLKIKSTKKHDKGEFYDASDSALQDHNLAPMVQLLARKSGLSVGVAAYYVVITLAFSLILRGLYVLLPYPLSGEDRENFDTAVPDAYLKTRSERILLHKRWKNN